MISGHPLSVDGGGAGSRDASLPVVQFPVLALQPPSLSGAWSPGLGWQAGQSHRQGRGEGSVLLHALLGCEAWGNKCPEICAWSRSRGRSGCGLSAAG